MGKTIVVKKIVFVVGFALYICGMVLLAINIGFQKPSSLGFVPFKSWLRTGLILLGIIMAMFAYSRGTLPLWSWRH